ncbi:hypothetical protein GQ600_13556 [Phytophthora cactorum]|nr:hypothetical protein GQ600_13556 [Phytophthora cactorum]
MVSRFETPNVSFGHFDRSSAKLSDSVIGHVLRRGRPRHTIRDEILQTPPETSSQDDASVSRPCKVVRSEASSRRRGDGQIRRPRDQKAIRREQCRHNQARYRDRQRAFQRRAQHEVQQLHEEVQGLKLKRQRLRFHEKTNRSAWSIVTDVFRLLETGFRSPWHMTNADEMMKHTETREILAGLQKAFEHDVGKGDLHGVEALAEQLRRYSLYFMSLRCICSEPRKLVPGVVTATAQLRLTVSEFTLRCVFPHLEKPKTGGKHVEAFTGQCVRNYSVSDWTALVR